jgi:hypothetical protein
VALGVGGAHHVGHLAHIDLQRVDAQVFQAAARGQPLGERFGVQHVPSEARAMPTTARRCSGCCALWAEDMRAMVLAASGADDAVLAQPVHQRRQSSGPTPV